MKQKIFLLDAFALIYRGYYAFIKNPRINSKGNDTSAIFGFLNSLLDILKRENPEYIAVCFDLGKTFRHIEYPEYKANRKETPEPISWGVPYIKEIIKNLGIKLVEKEGYEADDVIGTLSKKAEKEDLEVYMMTPDKDFCQLVSENIFLYKPARMGTGIDIMGKREVLEKYEFEDVRQMIDYLAMMGDASDNVPGLAGVGDKTARKFLKEYKDLEGLISNAENIKGKIGKKILANKDMGILSKRLVTIDINVPIDFKKETFKRGVCNLEKIEEIFNELDFIRSLNNVKKIFNLEESKKEDEILQMSIFGDNTVQEIKETNNFNNIENTDHFYQTVETDLEIELLLEKLLEQKEVCFDTETTSLNFMDAEIVGISFTWDKGKGYYLTLPNNRETTTIILEKLNPFFLNENILKIGHNLKYDLHILDNYNIKVKGEFFDTMIAHHLINSDSKQSMDFLAKEYLNYNTIPISDLIGKGKSKLTMRSVKLEKQKEYAVEDTDITFQLKYIFDKKLKESNLFDLFKNTEIPLMLVLKNMEREGINVDKEFLNKLSLDLEAKINILEREIKKYAEVDFNLSSPKQLGEILFNKLKIVDNPKKTKTGQYATSEDILNDLVDSHPIIKLILEWRTLSKLKSTYTDALPLEINKKTKRIHTNFNQTGTSTGRLSSNNPNLQNIPIRGKWGEKIREAFIKKNDNYTLLSADYSQIELRVMAEMSQEKNMLNAFKENIDIHTDTASRVFKINKDKVTKEQRSNAKTVNFGIIYGVSAFGLSRQTEMSRKESQEMIDAYNSTYPNLQKFINNKIREAEDNGFVETILGRKRNIEGINSSNGRIKSSADRNAINTPIQGSASDIIKIAMIEIYNEFISQKLESKMLLQVHDELVFDVKNTEKELVKNIIKNKMESAVKFSIPITVDTGEGDNWLEAH